MRIVTRDGVRRLRFSSTLADVGVGPLEVVPRPGNRCPKGERDVAQAVYQDRNGDHRYQRATEHHRVFRQAGCMVFHPAHNHWHIDASARYWLTRPGGATVLVRHSKVSFCLRDSRRLPDRSARRRTLRLLLAGQASGHHTRLGRRLRMVPGGPVAGAAASPPSRPFLPPPPGEPPSGSPRRNKRGKTPGPGPGFHAHPGAASAPPPPPLTPPPPPPSSFVRPTVGRIQPVVATSWSGCLGQ